MQLFQRWRYRHYLVLVKRKSTFEHALNLRIHIILRMRNISFRHLLSNDTFYCINDSGSGQLRPCADCASADLIFYFHIFNMDPFFHYTSQMTPLAVCNKLNDCLRTCSIGNKAKLSISGTRSAKLQKANARSVQFIAKQFKAFYTNWFKCTSL